MKIRFSCVVGADPTFAREALKGHKSLVELANVSDDILVHHMPSVSSEALAAFGAARSNAARGRSMPRSTASIEPSYGNS